MPISASMVDLLDSLRSMGYGSLETSHKRNTRKLKIQDDTWALSITLHFNEGTASVQGVVKGKWHFVRKNLETYQDLLKALWYFRKVIKQHLGAILARPYPPGHLKAMFGYYPDLELEINSKNLIPFQINNEDWLVHESEKIAFQVEQAQYKSGTCYTRVVQRHELGKEPMFYEQSQAQ